MQSDRLIIDGGPVRRARVPRAGLGARDVDVWRVEIGAVDAAVPELSVWLSGEERERAAALAFADDRRQFVVAHAALRSILSGYLGVAPSGVRIGRAASGKPVLLDADVGRGHQFSLSHSGGLALVAVARHRAVGVDVEDVDRGRCNAAAAERFLPVEDRARLAGLSPSERRLAFFACWTRREAEWKARGAGVRLARQWPHAPPGPFRVRPLDAGHGYAAAVSAEGSDWRLRCRSWPGATAAPTPALPPRD